MKIASVRSGLLIVVALACGCATTTPLRNAGRPFDFAQDTFAFANETVWRYEDGVRVTTPHPPPGERTERYTRRCFPMAAGVVQFWKFARFEPQASPVPPEELARRIRLVRNRAAWAPALPPEQRIVFPGYASFRDLSARAGGLLRANLGAGWTTYFHVRKYSMPFVPSPGYQAKVNEQIQLWLAHGQPIVLWLYNFPRVNINHAMTVFAAAPAPAPGQFAYLVYDPNYTDAPRRLVYDAASRSFSYGKTFYFVGGTVHVRPVYLGLFD
ncbi:MAG TPA: hypothetical protein VL486_16310 [Verrucomicrobiae bacterium]|nr:hypothetical protein [Verrucomicrobiae bacterium]